MKIFNEQFLEEISAVKREELGEIDRLNNSENNYPVYCKPINTYIAYLLNKHIVSREHKYCAPLSEIEELYGKDSLRYKFMEAFMPSKISDLRYRFMSSEVKCEVVDLWIAFCEDSEIMSRAMSAAIGEEVMVIGGYFINSMSFGRDFYLNDAGTVYYLDNPTDEIGVFAYSLQDFFIKIFGVVQNSRIKLSELPKEVFWKYYECLDELELELKNK